MVVALFMTVIGYQLCVMHASSSCWSVGAALTILLLSDHQTHAAQAGLVGTGITIGIGSVSMCVLFV